MGKRADHRVRREEIIGGKRLRYWVRRSRRARNILLHVGATGEVEVVVPWRASYRQGEQFLRQREQWLSKRLRVAQARKQRLPQRRLVTDDVLPFLGSDVRLRVEVDFERQRTHVGRRGDTVTVKVNDEGKVRSALVKWYKEESREYFWDQARVYALQLGVRVRSVQVLDTATQWGSCHKAKQALTFQWKLALAPAFVARYVVAHEVAHLRRADHSPAFWALVAELDKGYEEARAWLKANGYSLVL